MLIHLISILISIALVNTNLENNMARADQLSLISAGSHLRFPLRNPKSSCVLIGRDRRGHWVAMDKDRTCGGLFVSRDAALSYALAENGNRADAINIVEGPLELNADEYGCRDGERRRENGHDIQC